MISVGSVWSCQNACIYMLTGYRGTNGPMTTRVVEKVPMLQKFIEAGVEMGWPELEDNNGQKFDGIHVIFIKIEICFCIYTLDQCHMLYGLYGSMLIKYKFLILRELKTIKKELLIACTCACPYFCTHTVFTIIIYSFNSYEMHVKTTIISLIL